MPTLQLIGNPARRRRRHASKGKRRGRVSAKQRANRARFAAMARARSGGHKRRRRHAVAVAVHHNPRRRRRFHVASRRRRHNPAFRVPGLGNIGAALKTGFIGASGAIVNDVAYGFAAPFLPAMIATPMSGGTPNYAYTAGKIGMALLLGGALKRVPGVRNKAGQMTEGALIVTLHDLLKNLIVQFGIAVPMGEAGRNFPPRPVQQSLKAYPKLAAYPGGGGSVSMAGREAFAK